MVSELAPFGSLQHLRSRLGPPDGPIDLVGFISRWWLSIWLQVGYFCCYVRYKRSWPASSVQNDDRLCVLLLTYFHTYACQHYSHLAPAFLEVGWDRPLRLLVPSNPYGIWSRSAHGLSIFLSVLCVLAALRKATSTHQTVSASRKPLDQIACFDAADLAVTAHVPSVAPPPPGHQASKCLPHPTPSLHPLCFSTRTASSS